MPVFEKSIFLSDVHVPFADKNSMKVAISFMDWFRPDKIFLVGDILDFYEISTFDKDPRRITGLQADINKTVGILQLMRERNPGADTNC